MRLGDPWRRALWPAAVTLAITILRLTGELLDWHPALFDRAVGGGGALVGIIWLVPVFGAYFGYLLASETRGAPSMARVLGWDLAGLGVLASFLAVGFSRPTASPSQFIAIGVGSWAAIAVAWRGWPLVATTLLRYGLLARVPVAVVILLALIGDWGTHYDTPPPGLPEMGVLARWVAIGVIPQLTLWMAVTVVLGLLAAAPAAAIARTRSRRAAEA